MNGSSIATGTAMKKIGCLGLCLFFAVVGTQLAVAQTYQQAPSYLDSKAMRQDASLHAVDFIDDLIGVAVGDHGTILKTDDGGVSWRIQPSPVICQLRDVRWVSENRVVAVGGSTDRVTRISRGAVVYSEDAGQTWRRGDDADLPRLRRISIDPESKSLFAWGDFSHVALSYQFESRDGKSWQSNGQSEPVREDAIDSDRLRKWVDATGVSVPIRGVTSHQENVWAVGDHGVVLHSSDRGRSWRELRGVDRRAAVLLVAATTASVGWPLIGSESLESRNRVSTLIDQRLDASELDLASQVSATLGGAGVDAISSNVSVETAAANWIAIHQPSVVLLDGELSEATKNAFTNAAIAGKVPRIVSYQFESRGDVTLHRGALLPGRGVLLSDLWLDALHWVDPGQVPPKTIGLRRVYDSVGARLEGDTVTAGLSIEPARRLSGTVRPAARRHLQVAQARLGQPQLIAKLIGESRTRAEFKRSLKSLLDQTVADDQFRLAWSVLLSIDRLGPDAVIAGSELRASVLSEISDRFADMSVGKWAALQLYANEHSSEWQYLKRNVVPKAAGAAAKAVPVSPFQTESDTVRQVSALSPVVVPNTEKTYDLTQADGDAESGAVDLIWEFHPLVLVSREAGRHRGDDNQLQSPGTSSANLKRLVTNAPRGPWSRLLRNDSPAIVTARRAASRPKLDGTLDEDCWQSALSQVGSTNSLRVAYDEEYVYFAMRIPNEAIEEPASDRHPVGRRDHDLRDSDRVRLRIDTDLDLLTSMELEWNRAGLTRDSIDGNVSWQPTWYVASHDGPKDVEFEIAVLRRDLTELPIHPGQAWFVSVDQLAAETASPFFPMPSASSWIRVSFR